VIKDAEKRHVCWKLRTSGWSSMRGTWTFREGDKVVLKATPSNDMKDLDDGLAKGKIARTKFFQDKKNGGANLRCGAGQIDEGNCYLEVCAEFAYAIVVFYCGTSLTFGHLPKSEGAWLKRDSLALSGAALLCKIDCLGRP